MAEQQDAGGTPPAGASNQQPPLAGFRGSSTGEPVAPTPPEGGDPPAAGTPPEPPAQGGDGQPASGGDARPTVGHGGAEMSPEAISERVARERKKVLKEVYGTDDEREIAKLKEQQAADAAKRKQADEELEKFRKAEEERKRAQMTELQRKEADLKAKDEQIEKLRSELNEIHTTQQVSEQDVIVRRVFAEHVDETNVELVRPALARHYLSLTESEQKAFDERELKKWTKKFIQDHPALAKKPPEEPPAPAKHPRRAPVSTSKADPGTAAPPPVKGGPGVAGGKTVKPGQPNSMTKAELNQHYKETRGRRKPW